MMRLLVVCSFCSALCVAQTIPLDINAVLKRVVNRPSSEESEVTVARARLAWLEAAGGRKVEITPAMAVWSAVNPFSLATGLGANALSPESGALKLAILEAKVDVTSAEVVLQRRLFQHESLAVEQFAALAERQGLEDRQCQAEQVARDLRDRTRTEMDRARATQLDLLATEGQILSRRDECHQIREQRQVASLALATTLGLDDGDVQIESTSVRNTEGHALLPPEELYSLAVANRSDLTSAFEQQLRELWLELERSHDQHLAIVLKNNGAFDAQKQMVALKLSRLQLQVGDLTRDIRARIADIHIRAETVRKRLDVARRKLTLAAAARDAAERRWRAGLAGRTEVRSAEDALRDAGYQLAKLDIQYAGDATEVIVACGMADSPTWMQAQVFDRFPLNASAR